MKILLVLACLVFAFVGPAFAAGTRLDQKLEELYSERFVLTPAGVPAVTVGVMDGKQDVTFSCAYGGEAWLYQRDGSLQKVMLKRAESYQVQVRQGVAAKIRYWTVAFSLPRAQMGRWSQLVSQWKERGFPIKRLDVGSTFAIRGQLYDTRRRMGVFAAFDNRAEALRSASKLANRFTTPIKLHEELQTRPSVLFSMRGDGSLWQAYSLIEIHAFSGSIKVERVEFGRGYSWHTYRDRHYRGSVLLTADRRGRLSVVNQVTLPWFLRGLLRAEMPASAPLEALKAQAVCARNEILAKIGTRHRADPHLFCAHTHCQVYTGAHRPRRSIVQAIRQTRGQVMVIGTRRIIDAPFSALCGGHTEHNEHVWQNAPHPALRGKPDLHPSPVSLSGGIDQGNMRLWLKRPPRAYCQSGSRTARRRFRWRRTLTRAQLERLVHRKYPIGNIWKLEVLRRGVSGRAYLLRITGASRGVIVHGELNIRRLLGGLNSSMFVIVPRFAPGATPGSSPTGWTFQGGGWGHGVGMCQYGAMARARQGQSYKQILKHYYSGIRIRKVY